MGTTPQVRWQLVGYKTDWKSVRRTLTQRFQSEIAERVIATAKDYQNRCIFQMRPAAEIFELFGLQPLDAEEDKTAKAIRKAKRREPLNACLLLRHGNRFYALDGLDRLSAQFHTNPFGQVPFWVTYAPIDV